MANDVAGRYAEALFQLSKENNVIAERKEEAEVILAEFLANPELAGFFPCRADQPAGKEGAHRSLLRVLSSGYREFSEASGR